MEKADALAKEGRDPPCCDGESALPPTRREDPALSPSATAREPMDFAGLAGDNHPSMSPPGSGTEQPGPGAGAVCFSQASLLCSSTSALHLIPARARRVFYAAANCDAWLGFFFVGQYSVVAFSEILILCLGQRRAGGKRQRRSAARREAAPPPAPQVPPLPVPAHTTGMRATNAY